MMTTDDTTSVSMMTIATYHYNSLFFFSLLVVRCGFKRYRMCLGVPIAWSMVNGRWSIHGDQEPDNVSLVEKATMVLGDGPTFVKTTTATKLPSLRAYELARGPWHQFYSIHCNDGEDKDKDKDTGFCFRYLSLNIVPPSRSSTPINPSTHGWLVALPTVVLTTVSPQSPPTTDHSTLPLHSIRYEYESPFHFQHLFGSMTLFLFPSCRLFFLPLCLFHLTCSTSLHSSTLRCVSHPFI